MRVISFLLPFILLGCQADPGELVSLEEEWTAVLFEPLTFADSVSLRTGIPYSTFRVSTLVATGGDPLLRDTINNALATAIIGHVPAGDSTLEAALSAHADRLFANYRSTEVDEDLLKEAPHTYSRQEEYRTEVVYQSDSLYVLTNTWYGYQGGAHGMSHTELLTFTLHPVRRLRFRDVFVDGSEDTLSQLLTDRAKAPDMAGRIYVDTVPVTENMAPLPDGVRFFVRTLRDRPLCLRYDCS